MRRDFNDMTKSDMPFDTYTDYTIQRYEQSRKATEDSKHPSKIKKFSKKTPNEVQERIDNTSQEKADNNNAYQSKTDNGFSEDTSTMPRTRIKSSTMDLVDLEELNEQNIKSYRYRSRRNRVIIIVLVILLVLAVAGISIYASTLYLNDNCFLYIHGDCSATYIVDGEELSRFRTPSNLQGNRILEVDTYIRLETPGQYNIRFLVLVYQGDELLDNILLYEPNRSDFYLGTDNYYHSNKAIDGNATVHLFEGVILDYEYENTLNVDNFRMEVHTYFERV